MLGLTELNALLGAAGDNLPDEDGLIKYATKLCSAGGLSLMLCRPGSKIPWDTRTPALRKRDAESWDTLPEHLRPSTPDGMKGLHIATKDSTRIRALIRAAFKSGEGTPNLAINVGRSKLIVVDVDTPDEVQSFRDWFSQLDPANAQMWQRVEPTVTSPGTRDEHGRWAHHGGGHFWFRISDDDFGRIPFADLPSDMTIRHGDSHFSMFLGSRYVLVPPSRRPEGPYRARGPVLDAPRPLVDHLVRVAEERKNTLGRQITHDLDGDDLEALHDWYNAHPWDEYLTALNYTKTGVDTCGCDIWQRPGGSSPKSVTAHHSGCTSPYYGASEDPPLVIWTDNPGPELEAARDLTRTKGRAVSKAQVVAAMYHGGDMKEAFTTILATTGFADANIHYPSGLSIVGYEGENYPGSVPEPTRVPDPTPPFIDPATGGATSQWEPIAAAGPVSANLAQPPLTAAEQQGYPLPPVGAFDPYRQPFHNAPFTAQAREHSTPPSTTDDPGDDEESIPSLAADYESQAGFAPPGSDKYDDTKATVPDIVDLDEILARPRDIYLVEGLLQRSGRNAVVGKSNVGKSALLMDMLCSLTADPINPGANFEMWHHLRVMPSRVLYVAGEGARGAADRVAAWKHEHGRHIRSERFKMMARPVNFASGADVWYDLETRARAYFEQRHADPASNIGAENPVIVFDTLATMLTGVDENSATEMGKVMNRLETLRDALDCTIILVHHTGKGENADVMRGSSAIMGALDSVIMLTEVDMGPLEFTEPDVYEVFATGNNGVNKSHTPIKQIKVSVDKQRNFAFAEPFPMSLVGVPVRNPDGTFAPSQWTSPMDPTPTEQPPTAVIIGDRRGLVPVPKRDVVDLDATRDYTFPERVGVKPDMDELKRAIVRLVTERTTAPSPDRPTATRSDVPLTLIRTHIHESRGKYRIRGAATKGYVATLVDEAISACVDARVLKYSGANNITTTLDHLARRDREKAIDELMARLD